ncbi:uncharacterized protein (DUF305 family) [Actinoplanes octamycinicus]|uniref:Uncharacterized protein (DUF305 family) n=1 Tax=Actinoplanes octamycinicus TaxID=135948 RepID=A0A7W7M512_9ACTN|nr:DUF305 domain-containing protein [Actinoplanes octamycinicus]MBB4737206.1 uncharacterized protein (DUF305 family) [Actinoplanes octamycinicus]GIE61974.1 DUF305 domain-containing protein [Actinoplanes octamycinicus]
MIQDVTSPDAAPASGEAPAPRRRFGYAAVAVLLAGIVLGAAIGLVIPHFRTPADDSVEAGFLRDMSSHHAQAVEMAMIAHAGSDTPGIVTLAADIATTQQAQIGYMQAWLRDWDLSPTSDQQPMAWMPDSAGSVVNGLMPGMATPEQLASLRKATGKEQDIQFLTLMRAHHLGGIHMAQEAEKLSGNEDVDWLADSMVAAQQGEIQLIDDLLKQAQAG